jgi:hypothetical protein
MFRPFALVAHKPFLIIWLSNLSTISVSDEGHPETCRLLAYLMKVIQKRVVHNKSDIYVLILILQTTFNANNY